MIDSGDSHLSSVCCEVPRHRACLPVLCPPHLRGAEEHGLPLLGQDLDDLVHVLLSSPDTTHTPSSRSHETITSAERWLRLSSSRTMTGRGTSHDQARLIDVSWWSLMSLGSPD